MVWRPEAGPGQDKWGGSVAAYPDDMRGFTGVTLEGNNRLPRGMRPAPPMAWSRTQMPVAPRGSPWQGTTGGMPGNTADGCSVPSPLGYYSSSV